MTAHEQSFMDFTVTLEALLPEFKFVYWASAPHVGQPEIVHIVGDRPLWTCANGRLPTVGDWGVQVMRDRFVSEIVWTDPNVFHRHPEIAKAIAVRLRDVHMQGLLPHLKDRVWVALVKADPGPLWVTPRKLARVRNALRDDREFWSDLLDRHGLRNTELSDLHPGLRDHVLGNFWGMLTQTARQLGMKV
jgi:hypothetical protein